MKTQKIALVMAGGVSLGSYEAGVLTELLYALETLNARADDTGTRYELDVMTGGSAGGMTAALVGRLMMYDLPRRNLFAAWVDDIDILRLLDQADIPDNAVLSKQVIHDIADRYMVEGADTPPASSASYAPDTLHLSLSMSNMNGLTYRVPLLMDGGDFVSTFFSDMARFTVDKADPTAVDWRQVEACAVACGNFPIAFQPQRVLRRRDDYRDAVEASPTAPADSAALFENGFSFLDGGLFNNEPLGEAIDRATQADGGALESDRLFLLVDPNVNTSRHDAEVAPEDSLQRHALRILAMIRGESTARDWMRAQRTNQELRWRDTLVRDLGDILRTATLAEAPRVSEELLALNRSMVEHKQRMFGRERVPEDLFDRTLRHNLRQHAFREAHEALGDDGATRKQEIFERLVFALDNAAGLRARSELRLGFIGSNPDETAGDRLEAFGGFFERDWRVYDYRLGREKAHGLLPGILGLDAPYLRETDAEGRPHEDYDIPQEWRDTFPHVEIQDASESRREQLRDVVLERVDRLLKDYGLNWLTRVAIRKLVVKKKLDGFLGL